MVMVEVMAGRCQREWVVSKLANEKVIVLFDAEKIIGNNNRDNTPFQRLICDFDYLIILHFLRIAEII